MKYEIIIVGDSYTFGQGLHDREHYYNQDLKQWVGNPDIVSAGPSACCWASLAQQDFQNFKIINASQPGNSNDNMFKTLSAIINSDTKLVIFAGTFANRVLIKESNFNELITPWIVGPQWLYIDNIRNQPTSYIAAKESFIKHLYSDLIGDNYAAMAVLASWSLALTNQADFLWSIPQREPVIQNKQLAAGHIQGMSFQSIAQYPFEKLYNADHSLFHAVDGHTNEHGHKLYYEAEIKPMLQKLLK